jgi:hypothetical protein
MSRPFALTWLAVFLGSLTGCPSGSKGGTPTSSSPPPQAGVSLDTAQAIIAADGSNPSVQTALADIALSSSRSTTMRYLALRKLEEGRAPQTVPVGEKLALSGETSVDAGYLSLNGVAVIERTKTPEASAALARIKAASPQAAAAAFKLERSGH